MGWYSKTQVQISLAVVWGRVEESLVHTVHQTVFQDVFCLPTLEPGNEASTKCQGQIANLLVYCRDIAVLAYLHLLGVNVAILFLS